MGCAAMPLFLSIQRKPKVISSDVEDIYGAEICLVRLIPWLISEILLRYVPITVNTGTFYC